MTISDLEFFPVAVPRTGDEPPVRALLVRLATDRGIEGWGESALAWRPDELAARREALLPSLAGRGLFDIEELLTLDALDLPGLRAAVETACWDAIGRACNQPLCNLFGGMYRRRVPVAVRLPSRSIDRTSSLARELVEHGFHTQIVTATGDPAADVQLIDAIRDAIGPGVELRFDGAGRYPLETARELCAELELDAVRYFLDPVAGGDFERTAVLRRQTTVPLAISAGIDRPADLLAIARAGAADFVKIDPQRTGGLTATRHCAAVADAAGLDLVLGGPPVLGVATAAALHLAAAIPAFSNGNESVYVDLADDILMEPIRLSEGMLTVPGGPGLGIEIDRARLERYSVG